jgi:hypothetical protein
MVHLLGSNKNLGSLSSSLPPLLLPLLLLFTLQLCKMNNGDSFSYNIIQALSSPLMENKIS